MVSYSTVLFSFCGIASKNVRVGLTLLKNSFKTFLDPDADPDPHQNLIKIVPLNPDHCFPFGLVGSRTRLLKFSNGALDPVQRIKLQHRTAAHTLTGGGAPREL